MVVHVRISGSSLHGLGNEKISIILCCPTSVYPSYIIIGTWPGTSGVYNYGVHNNYNNDVDIML